MKRFLIDDLSEIAYMMYNAIIEDDFEDVMFVGMYDDAIAVLKTLSQFDETNLYYIDIAPEGFNKYNKEYFITLKDNMDIWCEKGYDIDNNCYLIDSTECLFIADDCNSTILKTIECDKNNIYEVGYNLEEECEGNCEECHCDEEMNDNRHEAITRVATDEDGKLRGFEKSWETHEDGLHYHSTYSFYSSNEDMLKDMLSNFNIEF